MYMYRYVSICIHIHSYTFTLHQHFDKSKFIGIVRAYTLYALFCTCIHYSARVCSKRNTNRARTNVSAYSFTDNIESNPDKNEMKSSFT